MLASHLTGALRATGFKSLRGRGVTSRNNPDASSPPGLMASSFGDSCVIIRVRSSMFRLSPSQVVYAHRLCATVQGTVKITDWQYSGASPVTSFLAPGCTTMYTPGVPGVVFEQRGQHGCFERQSSKGLFVWTPAVVSPRC
jgi:hypothetical protein